MADDYTDEQRAFAKWESELSYAQKDEKYKRWIAQSEKIVMRYRDERKNSSAEMGKRRYNVLWSNVQTLQPAVYGKMPKPVAERRFLDRDPVARMASLMLERTLAFQMDVGGYHSSTDKAVLDYLLPGMGQLWLRYEPEFESTETINRNKAEETEEDDAGETAEEEADEGDGEPVEKLTFERVCFDYVYFRDFLWGPSRSWDEVPWVAKRCWLDKSEARQAFGKTIANQMIFGDPKNKEWTAQGEQLQLGKSKKAEVWEIWEKSTRCVYFIAPDTPGLVLKTEEDDPLKLEGFWPCPEPLFTTQTNDTLIPVPDYVEYQDQAAELDTLTQRIAVVTTAIRANGTYNSEFPALQRLFQDGYDNKLIPVDDWAAFAEKGGTPGAVSLVPMDMLVQVLTELYNAREKVKQDLYEITGMSDIIRGASDPNETLGAQKIKATFATGRLGSRQKRAAEFCAEAVKIAAEIVSEVFSPESIGLMSGMDQMAKQAVQQAVEGVQPPPKPQPQQQGAPVDPQAMQQWQMQWDQMKRQAAMQAQHQHQQDFDNAIKLLRDDKLRGFRVDIETDSTIADDMQADKSAAVELVTSTLQALEAAAPVIQSAPEMVKPIGEMLMWAYRKYRVGRTMEASLEDALDRIDLRMEAAKNAPPAPDPEMIKAQGAAAVAQAKAQTEQVKAQAEQQRSQSDMQIAQTKMAGEQNAARIQAQLDAMKIENDKLKVGLENQVDIVKAKFSLLQAITVARIQAGADLDSANLEAEIEMTLGFATMEHEARLQERDHAQQATMQTEQQTHEGEMQANAPQPDGAKPKPKAKPLRKADQQHEEAMSKMAEVAAQHSRVAAALEHVGNGLHAAAQARQKPRQIINGADGRPVGIQ